MPDEVGHATDVNVNRGEGRGDGCLGGGEGDTGVGRLQGTTVVAPVAAHDGLPPLIRRCGITQPLTYLLLITGKYYAELIDKQASTCLTLDLSCTRSGGSFARAAFWRRFFPAGRSARGAPGRGRGRGRRSSRRRRTRSSALAPT